MTNTNLQIVQESPVPLMHILSHQAHKGFNFCGSDVYLQQLAIIVKKCCDGLLSQNVNANLFLHEAKVLCNVLL